MNGVISALTFAMNTAASDGIDAVDDDGGGVRLVMDDLADVAGSMVSAAATTR